MRKLALALLTAAALALPVLPSSDGTFWSDSGRIYGERAGYLAGQRIKMCQDDWIYDNGQGAIGNGAVHFRGITGIDYGHVQHGRLVYRLVLRCHCLSRGRRRRLPRRPAHQVARCN